jgi:hypothetical protein
MVRWSHTDSIPNSEVKRCYGYDSLGVALRHNRSMPGFIFHKTLFLSERGFWFFSFSSMTINPPCPSLVGKGLGVRFERKLHTALLMNLQENCYFPDGVVEQFVKIPPSSSLSQFHYIFAPAVDNTIKSPLDQL